MGRLQDITPQQDVVNKINAQTNFTHNINNTRVERYTVSIQNIFLTINPFVEIASDGFNSIRGTCL